ncbi:hypothetical protein Tco_0978152 [Tanacetum coccineum]|uniref:Uncharacterized protein n=1 Tax=Tanacetum coccineum TaxID=301880 RepID=A0ABQ5EM80_9ASTR
MVEGEEDEESYASEFADSVFQNDYDNSGTRIEPESHKENPETIVDDDENENEKKDGDDKKDDDNDDHTDHTLVGNQEMGSMETRKEKMQTPILSPTRSSRKNLSSDKTVSHELTETISPSTATTFKPKRNIREVLDHCNNVVHELTFAKTNEMLKEEVPRLVNNP